MWRENFLTEAYRQVRRNGGAAGVDRESFSDIEEIWSGELARELREGSYVARAARQVLNTGHHEVVDADLSNYFGQIPTQS